MSLQPSTSRSGRRAGRATRRLGVLTLTVAVVGTVLAAVPTTTANAAPAAPGATGVATLAVDPASRASVLQGYQKVWVPAQQVPSGWTGSTSPCVPGRNTAAAQSATLRAVNYVRQLAGRTNVTMDATLSAAALKGALIQDANNSLSHSPPSTWACWTQAGADASGRSNLFLNNGNLNPAASIATYMVDPGSGNSFVGHRRWVLFSRLAKIGSGTTARANALYVIDQPSQLPAPTGSAVAAWPSAGWFPSQLEPAGRWSVSIPGADFRAATVTVKKGATTLATSVLSRTDNGYGDNTLSWQVDPHYDIGQGNRVFTVTVAGYTVGGTATSTTYTTTLFDATVGMAGRNVITFPWPTAKKVGTTFDPRAANNNGLPVYYFSNTPDVCRTNFNPSTVAVLAPGTCSVMAYVGHDARYPDAPSETRTFTATR